MGNKISKLYSNIKSNIVEKIRTLTYSVGDGSWAIYPRCIYLSVNTVCNASCKMCDIGLKNKNSIFYGNLIQDGSNSLPIPTLQKLIDEVKHFKPDIRIIATEPLLYKDLLTAIRIIKENGHKLSIVTNGILLEKYAEDLVRLGVDVLTVSLDGIKQVNDSIRGEGIFEKVLSGLRLLKQYKNEYNKRVPYIRLNFTISSLNYSELINFTDYMADTGLADHISLSHIVFVTEDMSLKNNERFSHLGKSTPMCTKTIESSKIDIDVLWSQIQNIKERFDTSKVSFTPDFSKRDDVDNYYNNLHLKMSSKIHCIEPWLQTFMLVNGDFIVRCRCFSNALGNINTESFKNIWNGEKYKTFRRELKKHGSFLTCTRCCGFIEAMALSSCKSYFQ